MLSNADPSSLPTASSDNLSVALVTYLNQPAGTFRAVRQLGLDNSCSSNKRC